MTSTPVEQFESLASLATQLQNDEEQALQNLAAAQQRQDAAKVIADLLGPEAVQKLQDDISACQTTLTQLRERRHLVAQQMRQKQSDLGTEMLECLRAVTESLSELLRSVEARLDRDLRQVALQEASENLQLAIKLNAYLDSLQTASKPQAPTSPAPEKGEEDSTPCVVTQAEPELPALRELPQELSEYVTYGKSGYGLKNFATRYATPLQSLLTHFDGDLHELTCLLRNRGLNGGSLTPEMVETMLRNAGLSARKDRVRIMAPDRRVIVAATMIDATRDYLRNVIGLALVSERASRFFNSGFRVTRHVVTGEHELKLQGLSQSRAKALLIDVSRAVKMGPPVFLKG